MDTRTIINLILLLIFILALFLLKTWNALASLNERVAEAFSTMDIYLKKRWDLIPNLVAVVKGYAKHEKTLLTEVTELRAQTYNPTPKTAISLNQSLAPKLTKLLALAENYPELKADANFRKLHDSIVEIENEIANSRKYYNGCVRIFNTKLRTFPTILAAKLFRFKPHPLFTADSASKQNVKIEI